MTSPLVERTVIGGMFLYGKEGFQKLLDENFGGNIPQPEPWNGIWISFVTACRDAPRNIWIRTYGPLDRKFQLPASTLPKFPKALENADYFLPYTAQSAKSPEPFWVGFWSSSKAQNPYKFPENANGWENGRANAGTKNGGVYKAYIAACEGASK